MNYDLAAAAACDVDGNLPDDPCLKVLSPADLTEALNPDAATPIWRDTGAAFLRAALCTQHGQPINWVSILCWCTSTSGGGPQTTCLATPSTGTSSKIWSCSLYYAKMMQGQRQSWQALLPATTKDLTSCLSCWGTEHVPQTHSASWWPRARPRLHGRLLRHLGT